MTNAISVKKNEVNVVSLADNESGLVVTGSQKKEGFELKELSAETSHSKVINPGFFKYLSENDKLQKQAGIALACYVDHGDGGAEKAGKEGGAEHRESSNGGGGSGGNSGSGSGNAVGSNNKVDIHIDKVQVGPGCSLIKDNKK